MNPAIVSRQLADLSADRLFKSQFRYLPYIVVYCFVLYVAVAVVFGCIVREPRLVVRWNKENRFSQVTSPETDYDDESAYLGDDPDPKDQKKGDDEIVNSSALQETREPSVPEPGNLGLAATSDKALSRQMSQQIQKALSRHSLNLETSEKSSENHDEDLEANKSPSNRQDLCCRRRGICYFWGPTYYRYGLYIIYDSVWKDWTVLSNFLMMLTRIASFGYLLYYNLLEYVLDLNHLSSRTQSSIYRGFAGWTSFAVILYFALVSAISLVWSIRTTGRYLGLISHNYNYTTNQWEKEPTRRRRAYLLAACVHVVYETALVNAYFITLLSYLYFVPNRDIASDVGMQSMQFHRLRLFPAALICLDSLQNSLYIRWQSYPYILLLPGGYLAYQWVLVYLQYLQSWQDRLLETEQVYAFLTYGALLLLHSVVYALLGVGMSWLKIAGKLYLIERRRRLADENDEEEDDEEEYDDGNDEKEGQDGGNEGNEDGEIDEGRGGGSGREGKTVERQQSEEINRRNESNNNSSNNMSIVQANNHSSISPSNYRNNSSSQGRNQGNNPNNNTNNDNMRTGAVMRMNSANVNAIQSNNSMYLRQSQGHFPVESDSRMVAMNYRL